MRREKRWAKQVVEKKGEVEEDENDVKFLFECMADKHTEIRDQMRERGGRRKQSEENGQEYGCGCY